ncbi:hypothetical protein Hanom_Chr03g00185551 [Helianthus anomalus]
MIFRDLVRYSPYTHLHLGRQPSNPVNQEMRRGLACRRGPPAAVDSTVSPVAGPMWVCG